MSWPKERKEQTKQKIIETTSQLLLNSGYETITIESIMAEAQLTRGAFYNLFESKTDLYYQAIKFTIDKCKHYFADNYDDLTKFICVYLSEAHYFSDNFCPLSFLTTKIAHLSNDIRLVYDRVFQELVEGIQNKPIDDSYFLSSEGALQVATTLIGSMALARSIKDHELAKQILTASQQTTLAILDKYKYKKAT